jgi:hypothetical protein
MCSSTDTHYSNIFWVPSKCRNIILNPLKQEILIFQADIQKTLASRQIGWQEPERTKTIVETDTYKWL